VAWDYRIDPAAERDLRDLGPSVAIEIRRFLDTRVRGCADPRAFGKPLRGNRKGFWRYRVRDWRVLCRIEDQMLIVVVVGLGHRSSVYEN
jgi:mRNA interferase RelE/StbE